MDSLLSRCPAIAKLIQEHEFMDMALSSSRSTSNIFHWQTRLPYDQHPMPSTCMGGIAMHSTGGAFGGMPIKCAYALLGNRYRDSTDRI